MGSGSVPNIIPSRQRAADATPGQVEQTAETSQKNRGGWQDFKHLFKDYAMRHSHTSRISAKTILAFVGLGFAGACSDSVSAPTKEVALKASLANYTEVLGTTTFRYRPSKGVTQRIGDHVLVIPAHGICDLSSSYGPGTWDDPCAPATHGINITATTEIYTLSLHDALPICTRQRSRGRQKRGSFSRRFARCDCAASHSP